ncbi:Gp19/Gp15/Gp42 family protein [Corynebacterium lactis]|uniref:Head-to-tail adaptor n=1 Tax=Corynebacterium lactis RW2-5 TaxID=1408189 RepID=A0A0K2H3M8_9CORY|nr:Gp19/Gp15/Gp42 family protein [Corynebacterium lactis]ALA68553.1 hypothetical protein CLAC_07320 [Corynebacterium lactis RW2-5]
MFATVDDVRVRWQNAPASVRDESIVAVLDDAEAWLRASYPQIPPVPDEPLRKVLALVSVAMAKRALAATDRGGITQQQASAGSFSQSTSYRNPDGDLFLSGQEREMLESALQDFSANGAVSMEATGW